MRHLTLLLALITLPPGCGETEPDRPDADNDGVYDEDDCAPDDPAIRPGALDPYGDGVDSNCDGADGDDADGDGYPFLSGQPEWTHVADCNDNDPTIHPDAIDPAGDGIDADCDGSDGTDRDNDGHDSSASGGDDCDDSNATVWPGAPEACDGVDTDCQPDPSEVDADGDGWLLCGGDCDDTAATTNPAAPQLCNGVDDQCLQGEPPPETDDDHDGWWTCEGDCDDTDATVHPEADESCDAADLDCDGVPGATDNDGDGFLGCEGDCDDTDATRYPGAVERCNGLLDGCGSALPADEADADGDLWMACAGDCDDADHTVHPDLWTEVAGDGADDDCDGLDAGPSLASAWSTLWWDSGADGFGRRAVFAGDGDGDGREDVAVAAPGAPAGEVAFYRGVSLLQAGPRDPGGVSRVLRGEATHDNAGYALAGACDIDGDGLDELIVGAFGNDQGGANAGRVYIVDHNQLGPDASPLGLGSARWILTGEAEGDQAGIAVACAGDMDGDGKDEVVVGADGNDTGGSWAGKAYIVRGGSLPAAGGQWSLSQASYAFYGQGEGQFAGQAVAGGGDVDGDGLADVLVGAPMYGTSGNNSGRAYLILGAALGPPSLSLAQASHAFTGESANDQAGSGLAFAGDVDGNGLDDLLIGAPGHDGAGSDAGRVYVVLAGTWSGSSSWLTAADGKLDGSRAGAELGLALSGAGDVDGDGLADFLVGEPDHDGPAGSEAGRALLMLGASFSAGVRDPTAADLIIDGGLAGERAGAAVAGGGDLDGDARDDLLIGADLAGGAVSPGRAGVFLSPW